MDVVGRSGSGTYVSEGLAGRREPGSRGEARIELSRFGAFAAAKEVQLDFPQRGAHGFRYDFAYGQSDLHCFPFEMWRRMLMRHLRNPSGAFDYGPPAGSGRLREAICAHINRSRGVVCDPTQILVVSGSQQALDLVIRVLLEHGDEVAIEDPAYQGTREATGSRRQSHLRRDLLPNDLSRFAPGLSRPAAVPDRRVLGGKMALRPPHGEPGAGGACRAHQLRSL